MLVPVGFCHLLYDLHNVLVGRLHCFVHLWPISRGPVMFYLEALEVFLDPLGCEIRAIVRDEGVWDPVPGDDVVSNELFHRHGCDSLVGGYFRPLSKVVDRYEDEAMTVRSSRMYRASDINPSGGEGPWHQHVV